mmetsp:Transcript_17749/g.34404  ORF Transcript_17749/g.34404 Transcript_17749/m.34404 type:complete len:320 (+) Transcript_17749:64-1023(+)
MVILVWLAIVLATCFGVRDSGESSQTLTNAAYDRNKPLDGFLFAIMTSPHKRDVRENIRKTWGEALHEQGGIYKFFLGQSPADYSPIPLDEDDVVHLNFIDSYGNLTRKTQCAAKWGTSIPSMRFLVKIDDDVYPSIKRIADIASTLPQTGLYAGETCRHGEEALPDTSGKWGLAEHFRGRLPNGLYPKYADGPMYILSSDVAGLLGEKCNPLAPDSETFPFEDINTALVALKHNITVNDLNLYRNFLLGTHEANVVQYFTEHVGEWQTCTGRYVGYHQMNPSQMLEAYEAERNGGYEGLRKYMCLPASHFDPTNPHVK